MSEQDVKDHYERRRFMRQVLKNQLVIARMVSEVLVHIRAPNCSNDELHEALYQTENRLKELDK